MQISILLWKEDLETVIEKSDNFFSVQTRYNYWLRFDGLKKTISMIPYDHSELEQYRIEKKRQFLIDKSNDYVKMVALI